MRIPVTASLKWAYVLVILASIMPVGLAASSWVGLATGGSILGGVPFVGPMVFFIIGLYRLISFVKGTATLASYPVSGFALALRKAGVFGIYVGALVSVMGVVAGPLMRMLMTHRTDSGAEFFVVGVYLSLAGGLGILGLIIFEFSRLLGFEAKERGETLQPCFEPTVSGPFSARTKR